MTGTTLPTAGVWNEAGAAELLRDAELHRTDIEPITDTWPDLDLETAYAIQDQLIAHKIAAGDQIIGVKLGLTSRAKQQRMGLDSPLTAWLTDQMVLPAGAAVPLDELIHPRVEPEIAFVMGEHLAGPGVTAARALDAVAGVHAGLEVIDSRYRDFRFTMPDVVADNASSARFVLGSRCLRPDELDLALEGCVLQVDGAVAATATGAAVQGHPAEALALAANALGRRGVALEPGWIVLTGGMTDAVFAEPGSSILAEFTHLGSVSLGVG